MWYDRLFLRCVGLTTSGPDSWGRSCIMPLCLLTPHTSLLTSPPQWRPCGWRLHIPCHSSNITSNIVCCLLSLQYKTVVFHTKQRGTVSYLYSMLPSKMAKQHTWGNQEEWSSGELWVLLWILPRSCGWWGWNEDHADQLVRAHQCILGCPWRSNTEHSTLL